MARSRPSRGGSGRSDRRATVASVPRSSRLVRSGLDAPCLRRADAVPSPSGPAWVEQDSNLRRQCHQIYSLAPLATWVSTRSRIERPRDRCVSCVRARLVRPVATGRRRSGRAGGESRTHNRRFTKPVLCRLSYASDHEAVKFPTIPSRPFDARAFSVPRSKSRRPGRRTRHVPRGRFAAASARSERDRVRHGGSSPPEGRGRWRRSGLGRVNGTHRSVAGAPIRQEGRVGPRIAAGDGRAGPRRLRASAGRASPRWRSCGASPGPATRSGGRAPW